MDLPVRKRLPHAIPQWVADGSWFFITINCVPRAENQLCVKGVGNAVLSALAHNHAKMVWYCRLGLLMPDHLHAILAFPRDPGMATIIGNCKKFLAVKLGVKWQRDFFDRRLRNDEEVSEKTSYILQNPVRRGLCEREENWPWVWRPNDRLPPRLT